MDAIDHQLEELIQGYVEAAMQSPQTPVRMDQLCQFDRSKPDESRSDSLTVIDTGPCVIVLHRVLYTKGDPACTSAGES